jgi:hypothetical protein
LRRLRDRDAMNGQLHIDSYALMREICRYLAAVDAFRAELCEPTWLPELAPGGAAATQRSPGSSARARTSRTHRS